MIKTATLEALLESLVEDGDQFIFTLEGKSGSSAEFLITHL